MIEAAKNGATQAAPTPTNIVVLSEPVQFGEEKITQMEYRKPTGADIIECGHPLKINWNGDVPVTFDEKKMAAMMCALYRHPPSVIAKLSPQDWSTAAWAIAGFFMPDLTKI